VRLRYYVSHRLIKNSGEANKNGWRLPAEELEQKVAYVVRRHISKPSFIGSIAPNATVETVHAATAKLQPITTSKDIKPLLDLAEHVELQQGELRVVLAQKKVAGLASTDAEELMLDMLTITTPFQLRKRGVETKLIFADAPKERDEILVKNIANAHHWYC
jgi:hypothetical protein